MFLNPLHEFNPLILLQVQSMTFHYEIFMHNFILYIQNSYFFLFIRIELIECQVVSRTGWLEGHIMYQLGSVLIMGYITLRICKFAYDQTWIRSNL
jgi:hypothetical protein